MQSFTILQIPSDKNKQTSIVQCELKTQSGSITDFGTTNANVEGTDNTEILLNRAREKAMKRVEKTASSIATQPVPKDNYIPVTKPSTNAIKKQYNHDPNKKISGGQINYIQGLIKNDTETDRLCQERYNCTIYELNSQQAHEIIDSFKN